ncbi:MAG: ornithine carbamoyltransferase [Planctomycetes bacterium]|nr:ornithine carbamoyltransferase [Planctomycetota bacterium]
MFETLPSRLASKDLTRIMDLGPHEVMPLIELGRSLKADIRRWREQFAQRSLVMLFEKPSLRTRVSFDIGFARMGGHAVYLDHEKQRIGERESIADYSRNLERWCDCIVARTMKHETIVALAANAAIPVINALSDIHHPCQALADYMTLAELGFDFRRDQLAWVGDGNNVCQSLMELTATLGSSMIVVTPEGYAPSPEIVRDAEARACRSGASLQYTSDLGRIKDSFAVYTDTWTSMGQAETAEKTRVFQPYSVTPEVMAIAGPDACFMHCLPAHRGQEVVDAVIDGARSVVFDQAENRMHIQNALLLNLLATPTRDTYSLLTRSHS